MHLLLLAGLRVALPADHIVLGPGVREVALAIEGARGTPHVAVNVGQLAQAVDAGAGRWRVTWTPPPEPYPQVAVFGVWDDSDEQMALLPLWGSAKLPVHVDVQDAEVKLEIDGRKFSGHTDREGRAEIAFEAPPGSHQGIVRATDRLGNVKAEVVELGIPVTTRIVMVAPTEIVADGHTQVTLRVFAATADGRPDPTLALVDPAAPPRIRGPGIMALDLPPRRELGDQKMVATTSTGSRELVLRWVAGPPAAIDAQARPLPESGTWMVTARVVDAGSHPVSMPLWARTTSGALEVSDAPNGALETRYRSARSRDPGEVILTAGSLERRLVIEPVGRIAAHIAVRAVSTMNLGHVLGAGALAGGEFALRPRVSLLVESGVLLAGGDVPDHASFSFVGVPLRLGLQVTFAPPAKWQPYAQVHGAVLFVQASARGAMLPEINEGEVAAGGGGELGVRRRLGAGALLVALGWDYMPVISGSLLSGSLTGLTVAIGYRL
jgi:hypothetical protein